MAERRNAIIEMAQNVGVHLLDYCAVDCSNPWMCEGCEIDKAKRKLLWLEQAARLPYMVVDEVMVTDESPHD